MAMNLDDGANGTYTELASSAREELVPLAQVMSYARDLRQAHKEERTRALELAAALHELRETYETTLKALMAALDARDNETEGHSQRVTRYTALMAEDLGIAGPELDGILRGALLHDVGKIGVPDAILRKPGPLTEQEWEQMRRHPTIAHNILGTIKFLERAIIVPLQHHERFDGRGYPAGLKGDAIHIGARIFAIADTFDAMTSNRPYRRALPVREAIEEIKRNAGTQFDPLVVESFLRVVPSFLEIVPHQG